MKIKEYLKGRDGDIFDQAVVRGITYEKLGKEYRLTRARIGQIIDRVVYMQQLLKKYGNIETDLAKKLDHKGFKNLQQAKDMGTKIMMYPQFGPMLYSRIMRA